MNDEAYNRSAAKKITDFVMAAQKRTEWKTTFKDFYEYCEFWESKPKILIHPKSTALEDLRLVLNEATKCTVGNYTARRDPPHFQGDEYHAHCEIPGGYEASYSIQGKRRHPNKFPAQVPRDALRAIANVLNRPEDIFEAWWIEDTDGKRTLLLEMKS